jgi:hypothetical protein
VVVGWEGGGGGHGHALDGEQRHGTRGSERTGKTRACWNGGCERIRLDKDKERAAVFGWPG